MQNLQNPPTGTVTFLFTDIEGSTKRWEQYPQQMQVALQRHDTILRQAIQEHGAHVFKTMGDAFCAAFSSPHAAVGSALDLQHALLSEQWPTETGEVRVRAALHTGAVEEQGGDYFGQPVNRVARLLSAGHGGQTLLSLATQELVRDNLPAGVSLLDMGEHRLKDLIRPERIFQLTAASLPSEFPPLKTLSTRPNNLPLQPTPLIGREKEVASVVDLVSKPDVRLVTLTGPGGTGKTRLSLQAAAELLDLLADGVWFVELAALAEARLVVPAIAHMLAVQEAGGTPLIETLKEHLKDKHLLLVLDNFEQVADAANDVSQLLRAGAGVKVLVTSRTPLRLRGEREYAVPPLSMPDLRHLPALEKLTQYEAVRLFIERAVSVKADFQVTNENAPAVAEICVRLDGLPLSIELAAARSRMLPPHALLTRLSQRLKMLTGGARDLTARQQTLRGAIDWSYDLLDGGHKQLLWRMAVFDGGRTLEALEEVCNFDGHLLVDVFDGVETLLSNSLLQQREGSDGEPRFWMLETIHEYAREKLQESGEAQALQKEHALYFMRLAEEAEPHLTGKQQQGWLERLEDEYDNLRAALAWAREQAHGGNQEAAEIGLRTAGAIWRFWLVRSQFTEEGREQLAKALSVPEAVLQLCPATSRAKAMNGASYLAHGRGDSSSARSLLEGALVLGREAGHKQSIADSLNFLGIVTDDALRDVTAARALYEESLALRREIGDKWGISACLHNLACMARDRGDYQGARALFEESLALRREIGDKWAISASLGHLGVMAQEREDYQGARALYEESLALRREVGDKGGIADSLKNFALVAWEQGDYTKARALYEEGLALTREIGDKRSIPYYLNNLGLLAQEQGDFTGARALHEESLALRRELGNKVPLPASLAGLGELAIRMGQVERGATLLGAVEGLLGSMGAVLGREDRLPYERSLQQARSLLGEQAFERVRQEGRAMSMEEAIEYALEQHPEQ